MFFINLILLILTGTLMLGWVLYFTDWFPVIGGLLGLGGLFAWIAFLGNVVSSARKDQVQAWFDEKCLQRPWMFGAVLVIAVGFGVLVPGSFGTIVINNEQHDRARTVDVRLVGGEEKAARLVVPARGVRRHVVATGLFGARAYRIKAAGLPWAETSVAWLDRKPLEITGDFRRRHIVLIRPHAEKLRVFGEETRTLRVTLSSNGQATDLALEPYGDYRGQTAWLGAAADVEPTGSQTLEWRFELERALTDNRRLQHYRAMWNRPISLTDVPVAAGATISARVTRHDSEAPIIEGQQLLPASTTGSTITEVIMQ